MSAHRLPEALRVASNARGNGLPATQWVMIADATPARADVLLEVLGASGIPARAARVRPRSPRGADTRVWVDVDRLARAENVLMAMLGADDSNGCAAPRVPPAPVENTGSALFDDLLVGRLRSSWGFCTSHAWLYLCMEAELPSWPVANGAIYRDLTCHAVRLLEARHGRRRTYQALAGIEPCMLCEYGTDPAPFDKVIAVGLTRGWAARFAATWADRRCPRCLPGAVSAQGVLCRLHTSGRDMKSGQLCGYLAELAARLSRCSGAALVEAVGWSAGWHRAAASIEV